MSANKLYTTLTDGFHSISAQAALVVLAKKEGKSPILPAMSVAGEVLETAANVNTVLGALPSTEERRAAFVGAAHEFYVNVLEPMDIPGVGPLAEKFVDKAGEQVIDGVAGKLFDWFQGLLG